MLRYEFTERRVTEVVHRAIRYASIKPAKFDFSHRQPRQIVQAEDHRLIRLPAQIEHAADLR